MEEALTQIFKMEDTGGVAEQFWNQGNNWQGPSTSLIQDPGFPGIEWRSKEGRSDVGSGARL